MRKQTESEVLMAPKSMPLGDQVAFDMAQYLDRFPNKSFAIRVLARECELNEKTIKRILNRENKPTYQTLTKLYSVFFEIQDFDVLLEKCPEVVRSYIEDYSPTAVVAHQKSNDDLIALLKKEPLLAEIYILAGTNPIDVRAIGFRYGQYGVELVEKLANENILVAVAKDKYILSPTAPNLDGDALKFLGEYFVHRFSKPKAVMSENTIAFYAEGLNEEGMKEWLKIDDEAFYKKLEIAKQNKFRGTIPVFTFCATDTILKESK